MNRFYVFYDEDYFKAYETLVEAVEKGVCFVERYVNKFHDVPFDKKKVHISEFDANLEIVRTYNADGDITCDFIELSQEIENERIKLE